MGDLEVFLAIWVMPFVLLGLIMWYQIRRDAVRLTDAQSQAGSERRARKGFLLRAWRTEK